MTSDIFQELERFIAGNDTSIRVANKIESALDEQFPRDDYIQQTVEMLAMYRPEGGEYLFNTTQIRIRLVETMEYLTRA